MGAVVRGPVRAVVRVVRDDCLVMGRLYSMGLKPVSVRVKPGPERSVHVITLQQEIDEEALRTLGAELVGKRTAIVVARSCSACRVLSQLDVYVVGDRPLDSRVIDYELIAPSRQSLKVAISRLTEAGLSPVVLRKEELRNIDLTPRQLQFLLLAYREGLFCVDRKTTLNEIAKKMGIKPGSLVDIMRRALMKVIKHYLISEGIISLENEGVINGCGTKH